MHVRIVGEPAHVARPTATQKHLATCARSDRREVKRTLGARGAGRGGARPAKDRSRKMLKPTVPRDVGLAGRGPEPTHPGTSSRGSRECGGCARSCARGPRRRSTNTSGQENPTPFAVSGALRGGAARKFAPMRRNLSLPMPRSARKPRLGRLPWPDRLLTVLLDEPADMGCQSPPKSEAGAAHRQSWSGAQASSTGGDQGRASGSDLRCRPASRLNRCLTHGANLEPLPPLPKAHHAPDALP